jgi:predicted HTH domain antitoxin
VCCLALVPRRCLANLHQAGRTDLSDAGLKSEPGEGQTRGLAVLRRENWYTWAVTLSIEIPESTLRALGPSPSEAEGKVRLAAAMKLHEMGNLSAGAAADLAGIPKVEFLHKLADFGVEAFRVNPEQFDLDQDTLRRSLG